MTSEAPPTIARPAERPAERNIRLTVAYDGTAYVGWQIQPNGVSVQSKLQDALKKLTGEDISVLAAGRTDSGVHALGQAVNFVTRSSIPADKFRPGLQNSLPSDIVVRESYEVPLDFHATYSAVRKRYRYVIANHETVLPFMRRYAYHYRGPLNEQAMHEAGQVLLGKHDFRCFESHFPNKATSVRTIQELRVRRLNGWSTWDIDADQPSSDGQYICLDIVADGFLYNMVRAITGTLLRVGQGRWSKDDVARILANQDRSQAGETAPAEGLYLVHVDYDEA